LDFEVSTVANDTYYHFVELGKKCRTDLEQAENKLKGINTSVAEHEAALVALKKSKEAVAKQIDLLKNKAVEVANIVSELEKNKRQFKSIVTTGAAK
jgi:chromosome segregation ATPase